MKDYLWDKTGEPDAEVERLENLLAGMRFEPREFRVPPEVVAQVEQKRSARPLFSRPAYAAAAAAVAVVVFAALMFAVSSRYAGTEAEPSTLARTESSRAEEVPAENGARDARAESRKLDEQVASADGKVAGGGPQATPERPKRLREPAPRGLRKQLEDAPDSEPRGVVAVAHVTDAALKVPAALSEEQRRAKEQLMFALRLTSAKFNVVQKRTLEAPNNPKTAFDERDKIR